MPLLQLQRSNGINSKNTGRSNSVEATGGSCTNADSRSNKSRKCSDPVSSSSSQWFKKSLVQLLKDQEWDKVSMRLRSNYGRFEVSRTVKEPTLSVSAASAMTKSTTTALHLACQYCAPLEIIQQLIQIHPQSLETYSSNTFGKKRALPLHMACRFYTVACSSSLSNLQGSGVTAISHHNNAVWKAMAVLETLCRAYPEALDLSSIHGSKNASMLPLDIARHYNAPNQLIQILKQGSEFHRRCNFAHPSERNGFPLKTSCRENITAAPCSFDASNSPEGSHNIANDCEPWPDEWKDMSSSLNDSFGYCDNDGGIGNHVGRNRITSHDYTAVVDNRGGGDAGPRGRITSLDYTAVVDNRRPCKNNSENSKDQHYDTSLSSPSSKEKTSMQDLFSSPDPTALTSSTSYYKNKGEVSMDSKTGDLLALRSSATEDTMDVTTEDEHYKDDDSCSTLSKSIRFQYDSIPHNSSSSSDENIFAPGQRKNAGGRRQTSIPLVVEVPILQPKDITDGSINEKSSETCTENNKSRPSRWGVVSFQGTAITFILVVLLSYYFANGIQFSKPSTSSTCANPTKGVGSALSRRRVSTTVEGPRAQNVHDKTSVESLPWMSYEGSQNHP